MPNDTSELHIRHEIFSCEEVYSPDNALMDLRAHDSVEICMIAAGSGIHLVLDQAIPCKAGDVFVTPPGIPHKYLLESAEEMLTLRQLRFYADEWLEGEIAATETARYCYGLFNDGSITAYAMLNSAMRERIGQLYDTIECELLEQKNEWRDVVKGCLSQLLITVERYIDSSIQNFSSVSPKEWSTALATIRIVKSNYGDCNLTLESVADQFFVSKSHLSKTFQSLTGQPFSEYLRRIRMEHACEMLRTGDLTVPEIVWECGLRDLSTFYKNFNSHVGMTPNEYRQLMNSSEHHSEENIKKTKEERTMAILNDISENLQRGKAKIVKELVQQALDEGFAPEQILGDGLLSGMGIIGEKFKNNEIYVPEVLVAARAMDMGAQILKPHLAANGVQAVGKVCIGTVQGDLHDIGKNLVKMMLEGKGLEVVDLGTDVPAEKFIQTAIDENCQVICCSALLTTTMPVMADVVKAAEAAGVRDKVKIMVGGAPVNQEFCDQIGADCYTADAASAADAAVEFCKG